MRDHSPGPSGGYRGWGVLDLIRGVTPWDCLAAVVGGGSGSDSGVPEAKKTHRFSSSTRAHWELRPRARCADPQARGTNR